MKNFKARNDTLGVFDRVETEQLGYCNAFVRRCYKIDRCLGDILCREELISYSTPVISAVYDMDGDIVRYNISQTATCSTSTRKQVGRFLHEIGSDYCYLDIKDALKRTYPNNASIIDNLKAIECGADYLYGYDVVTYEDAGGFFENRYESIKPIPQYYY